jgi:hypothetical protein
MRIRILVLVCAGALAGAPAAAAAHGKLDVRTASFAQAGRTLRFSVTTWRPWSVTDLQSRATNRGFCVLIWTKSPSSHNYDFSACAEVRARTRNLLGYVFENGNDEESALVGRPALRRLGARTITIALPARLIDSPRSFRWRVRTFYTTFAFTPIVREQLR